MNGPATVGVVSFSIDVSGQRALGSQRDEVAEVVTELLARFDEHGVAASWAMPSPASSPLTRQIAASRLEHDIALLVDDQAEASQSGLALVREIHRAAAAGVTIRTIASRRPWRLDHADLLARQGVSVLRGPRSIAAATKAIKPPARSEMQPLCYGLWHVAANGVLSGGGWLANMTQMARIKRLFGGLAKRGGLGHVAIDAALLARGDVAASLRGIDRMFRHLGDWQNSGRLAAQPLPAVAESLLPKRSTTGARSILRAA